jgi:outer membrane protein TolC
MKKSKSLPIKLLRNLRFSILVVGFVLGKNVNAEDRFTRSKALTFLEAGEMAAAASVDLWNSELQQSLQESTWKWGARSYFPQVSFSVQENDRVMLNAADSFQKNYSVQIEQLLFDGGKLIKSRRMEKSKLLFQRDSLKSGRNDIIENAIAVYRQVLQARYALEIQKNNFAALEKQKNILLMETELGLALPSDIIAAEITVAESQLEIFQIEIEIAETEKQFAELLGLEELPPLAETIDVRKKFRYPSVSRVISEVMGRNPELQTARLSLKQKEEESKLASFSWIPTLSGNGTFSLAGDRYPLSQFQWSVGFSISFDTPFLANDVRGSYGREDRTGRTALLSDSAKLLPSPQASLAPKAAKLALLYEQKKLNTMISQLPRTAEQVLEKIKLIAKKKELTVQTEELSLQKIHVAELRHSLGQLTRLEMMEMENEYAQSRLASVEAAIEELSAIRELEKMMALNPGELERL